MDSSDLPAVLRECGVSDENITKMVDAEWLLALLALAASSADAFATELPKILSKSPAMWVHCRMQLSILAGQEHTSSFVHDHLLWPAPQLQQAQQSQRILGWSRVLPN